MEKNLFGDFYRNQPSTGELEVYYRRFNFSGLGSISYTGDLYFYIYYICFTVFQFSTSWFLLLED